MPKQRKKIKAKSPVSQALALLLFGIVTFSLPARAQSGSSPGISLGNGIYAGNGTTTLRDPLIPGASFSLPYIPSAQGAAPPPGSGLVPLPVTPGSLLYSTNFNTVDKWNGRQFI